MTKVRLGLFNEKGGVGKTTSAAALATYYGSLGYRVLAVDIDQQGNLSKVLGIDLMLENGIEIKGTTADLIGSKVPPHTIALQTYLDNVFLIPSSKNGLAEIETKLRSPSTPGADRRLSQALDLSRDHYDIVVIKLKPYPRQTHYQWHRSL